MESISASPHVQVINLLVTLGTIKELVEFFRLNKGMKTSSISSDDFGVCWDPLIATVANIAQWIPGIDEINKVFQFMPLNKESNGKRLHPPKNDWMVILRDPNISSFFVEAMKGNHNPKAIGSIVKLYAHDSIHFSKLIIACIFDSFKACEYDKVEAIWIVISHFFAVEDSLVDQRIRIG